MEQINKKFPKIYDDWVAEVVFAPITGGEFFQLLLQAHNSELWVQRPLCCFTPEYQSYLGRFEGWKGSIPFNTVHTIERVKRDCSKYILVYLSCSDIEYINELRKWKSAAIKTPAFEAIRNFRSVKQKSWHRSITDDLSTQIEHYDVIIKYFNPIENYYELCSILKMQPDIDFYKWAWIGYLTWQKVFLKSNTNKNKINKTIKYLKEELPKGYKGWTYKSF